MKAVFASTKKKDDETDYHERLEFSFAFFDKGKRSICAARYSF